MSESKRTFTVNKNKSSKKDRSILPVLIVALLLSVAILTPAVRYAGNIYGFDSFMNDLRESFISAQKFNGFTATYKNKECQIDKDSGSAIFANLNLIGRGIKCKEEENQNPFILEFGDGSTMLLAESEMKGRFQNTVRALYVEYTYPTGKKYCYKTDQTSFNYLLESIIKYYFPE